MKKYLALFVISILSSCQVDPLTEDASPSFDKIYALSENVEAIDFIAKPDNSGYIILGNFKNTENSDIFLIDVRPDGMQESLQRINTSFFDEGKSITIHPDQKSLLILGQRRGNGAQTPVTDNFLIKTDLKGVPVIADNSLKEDSVTAELKFLPKNSTYTTISFNDITTINSNLILVGHVTKENSTVTNKITQIYNLADFNFADTSDVQIKLKYQKPTILNFDNSKSMKIMPDNKNGHGYSVIGQSYNENPLGEIAGSSFNISWGFFTDAESSASALLYLGSDKNEVFGDALAHTNGKTYFGGHYTEDNNDSIFIITKEFNGVNTNSEQTIVSIAGFGSIINSMAEDSNGNIIIATRDKQDIIDISYLLKFSQSGQLIDNEDFKFLSTGLYNIKKIESEPNNVLVILSQKTFENNSTAIGLMKIKF